MILTVTTVRDTPERVLRFCQRNLDAGADHVVLFLDEPDAEVEGMLAEHRNITTVVPDLIDDYWRPERPGLNGRQVINANIVNSALAGFDWADWLFGIDADEVLEIDRQRLLDETPPVAWSYV